MSLSKTLPDSSGEKKFLSTNWNFCGFNFNDFGILVVARWERYWQIVGLEPGSYQANCGDKVTIYFHKRYYITSFTNNSQLTEEN